MTTGERIQALRKEKGLSQETLGEALGVSRQAISKWESDAALPEVEKLVAMSRLFCVSVGELLGVEQAQKDEGAADPQELTERELYAVETIVNRYLAQAEARRPRRRKWPRVLALLGAAIVLFIVGKQLSNMNGSIRALQNTTSWLSSEVNTQIGSLTSRVEDILERQNSVVADSGGDITDYLPEEDLLCLEVYAVPKQYTEGMAARFTAEGAGFAPVTAAGVLETQSTTFRAVLRLPPTEEAVRVKVVFDDGTQQLTQLLDTWYDLGSAVTVDLDSSCYLGQVGPVTGGELAFHGQVGVFASLPDARFLKITDLELCVRRSGEVIEVIPLAGEAEKEESYLWTAWIEFDRSYPVKEGDRIEVVARAQDSFGVWHEAIVTDAGLGLDENGILNLRDGARE